MRLSARSMQSCACLGCRVQMRSGSLQHFLKPADIALSSNPGTVVAAAFGIGAAEAGSKHAVGKCVHRGSIRGLIS